MKKIAFKTLGCRLNQFETDSLASQFGEGYKVVKFNEEADVYVINTCTVTNQSDHKSRNIISQATRKTDDAIVIVTGCMANNYKDELKKRDGVTYVVTNEQKSSVYSIIDSHLNGEIVLPDSFEKDLFSFPVSDKRYHVKGLVKIQDGCDNFCTYCIIPFVRGRAASRPDNEIIDNVKKLVNFGYKEIVLTGVNIGRYQYGNTNFEDLVEQILNLSGDFRVRISSIEPEGFGEKLFSMLSHPKLAPHLHMCLQSGSEKILKQMHRMYTADEFYEMAKSIKKHRPDINLTTDIIIGFPNETEEDFNDSIDMITKIGFSHVHTFKFSERDGTKAVKLTGKISDKIKNERSEIIRKLSEKQKREYRASMIGKTYEVLVEKTGNEYATGYNEYFVPVKIMGNSLIRNEIYYVKITEIENGEDPFLLGDVKMD